MTSFRIRRKNAYAVRCFFRCMIPSNATPPYYGVTFPLMPYGWTSQTGGAAANGVPGTNVDPFDVQIACWPVITFDQRTLFTPFPLTSGVLHTCLASLRSPHYKILKPSTSEIHQWLSHYRPSPLAFHCRP